MRQPIPYDLDVNRGECDCDKKVKVGGAGDQRATARRRAVSLGVRWIGGRRRPMAAAKPQRRHWRARARARPANQIRFHDRRRRDGRRSAPRNPIRRPIGATMAFFIFCPIDSRNGPVDNRPMRPPAERKASTPPRRSRRSAFGGAVFSFPFFFILSRRKRAVPISTPSDFYFRLRVAFSSYSIRSAINVSLHDECSQIDWFYEAKC